MGPWRTLISKAMARRGARDLPSSASSSSIAASTFSSLAEADQQQPCPLVHNGRFIYESAAACPRLSERIWSGLGLGFSQNKDQEALLADAKDFLLDSSLRERPGRLNLGLPEGFSHLFNQRRAEFAVDIFTFKKPWLDAELSMEKNARKHAEDVSLLGDAAMQAPGFCGSEASVIYADSVKRKRKKKMNKHKHRKLRRLARKSHK